MRLLRYLLWFLSPLLLPILGVYGLGRLWRKKELWPRILERFVLNPAPRPNGDIFWIHGASVGEMATALSLVHHLLEQYPKAHIVLTTQTVGGAMWLQKQDIPRTTHQFLPFDLPIFSERFIRHWRPRAVFWVEAEFWPIMLGTLAQYKIPTILLNGRLSLKTFTFWQNYPMYARSLFGTFSQIFPQSEEDQARFQMLTDGLVSFCGNLKFSVPPLPAPKEKVQEMQKLLGSRPFWLAVSTHPGEEEIVLKTHAALQQKMPDLCLILIPRHPKRAPEIEQLVRQAGLASHRRTTSPVSLADVYLVDTFGELGIFFALQGIVFMGGSFVPVGGHSLIEPAHFSCPLLNGPNAHNNLNILKEFDAHQAIVHVTNETLYQTISDLLSSPDQCQALGQRAFTVAQAHKDTLGKIVDKLRLE